MSKPEINTSGKNPKREKQEARLTKYLQLIRSEHRAGNGFKKNESIQSKHEQLAPDK
jgi:hypothetical protein